ncbi:MAG TPA: copper resistance protein CopC [Gaiellaceae bacterium]|nr:copper resistance protein CopC [Gaiellaceae bacterium]
MNARRRLIVTLAAGAAVALAVPAAASAHAYLIKTVPAASTVLNTPPTQLALTYDEAVEPRFMIVSVTDAAGTQETSGRPYRSTSNADTIITPLEHLNEGWYLVFWRAISADGHPVRGVYEFAVGPNEGPPPQFPIPSLTEGATTPSLLTFRWLSFLALMTAIGLFCLRTLIARPIVERLPGTSLRPVTIAFGIASLVALIVIPVYVDIATAQFAFHSIWDVTGNVPLMRDSAFGRGWTDTELVFALFVVAAAIAVASDRPERRQRSTAGLLSLWGALAAAAAAIAVPALTGHAPQTPPKGLSTILDWIHLSAGSLWLGGLIGLLILWWTFGRERRIAGLAVTVPRFSHVALGSVLLIIGSGVWATFIHLPTLSSLWQTSYGDAIIAKIALLVTAMAVASGNLLRTRPRLQRAHELAADVGVSAGKLLRGLVGTEVLLVLGALFAAGILSSLPPPPKALATIGAISAHVGPGPANVVVKHGAYRLVFHITPNKAVESSDFTVTITKNGKPVHGATVLSTFAMLDMEMPNQEYSLAQKAPGKYGRSTNALLMVGHWGLSFEIEPPHDLPFTVTIEDHAVG